VSEARGQTYTELYRKLDTKEFEVKKTLKKMKTGKALGSDDILIEVWRCLGDIAIVWLTKLFNIILRSNKMFDE
jgi:hypothetical protein